MPETNGRTAKLVRRTDDDAAPESASTAAVDEAAVEPEEDAERDATAPVPDADAAGAPVAEADDDSVQKSRPRPARRPRTPVARRVAGRPNRQRVVTGALVVALIAGLVAVVVFGRQWYAQRQIDAAHQQAVAAAKQVTVNFMSISAATVDRDLKRIAAGATGEFRDEFTRGMGEVRATVVENKVDSRATILQAGLVSGDRDSAVVLVAVDATVKNAHAPDGRLAHYRIQVDVARDARSGAWLVSRLQFVG